MPNDTYRVTWEFESLQQQTGNTASARVGWTESWYTDQFTSIEQTLEEAINVQPQHWLGLRLAFMAEEYRCAWVKATNIKNKFETKTVAPPSFLRGNAVRPANDPRAGAGAQVNCAAMVDFYAPPLVVGERSHHRRMLFRGLPWTMIDCNIMVEGSRAFGHMIDFCTYVGTGRSPVRRPTNNTSPWRMLIQGPGAPKAGITALEITANTNGRKITINGALGVLSRGDRVIVSGVKFPFGCNRVWTVLDLSPNGGPYPLGTSRRQLSGVWDQIPSAKAQLVTPEIRTCSQFTVIGLRNRKTGSPLAGTRGRRRGG